MLLPPACVSERDRSKGTAYLLKLVDSRRGKVQSSEIDRLQKSVNMLDRSRVNRYGCIVGGLKSTQKVAHLIPAIAQEDWGSPSFDTPDDINDIRLCDTPNCCNTRHYDLEFSRPTLRERRIELDLSFYQTQDDGSLKTIWGDELPSYLESLSLFAKFVRLNYPYRAYEDSRLSATAISQIRIVPITWMLGGVSILFIVSLKKGSTGNLMVTVVYTIHTDTGLLKTQEKY